MCAEKISRIFFWKWLIFQQFSTFYPWHTDEISYNNNPERTNFFDLWWFIFTECCFFFTNRIMIYGKKTRSFMNEHNSKRNKWSCRNVYCTPIVRKEAFYLGCDEKIIICTEISQFTSIINYFFLKIDCFFFRVLFILMRQRL